MGCRPLRTGTKFAANSRQPSAMRPCCLPSSAKNIFTFRISEGTR